MTLNYPFWPTIVLVGPIVHSSVSEFSICFKHFYCLAKCVRTTESGCGGPGPSQDEKTKAGPSPAPNKWMADMTPPNVHSSLGGIEKKKNKSQGKQMMVEPWTCHVDGLICQIAVRGAFTEKLYTIFT